MSIILEALKKAEEEGKHRKLTLEKKKSLIFLNRSHLKVSILLVILTAVPLVLLSIYLSTNDEVELKSLSKTVPSPSSSSITVEVVEPLQKANDHHQSGIRLFKEGRFSEAEGEFLKAIELNPGLAEAYNNLGLTYWRQGKKTQAIEKYKKALDVMPNYAEAMNNLAIIYDNDGKYNEAIQLYMATLKLRPNYAEAHLNFAIALEKMRRPGEAREHYKAFLDLARSPDADRELLDKVKRRIEVLPPL